VVPAESVRAGDLSLPHPDVFSGAEDTHAAQRNSAALRDMRRDMMRAIVFPKAGGSRKREFLASQMTENLPLSIRQSSGALFKIRILKDGA